MAYYDMTLRAPTVLARLPFSIQEVIAEISYSPVGFTIDTIKRRSKFAEWRGLREVVTPCHVMEMEAMVAARRGGGLGKDHLSDIGPGGFLAISYRNNEGQLPMSQKLVAEIATGDVLPGRGL